MGLKGPYAAANTLIPPPTLDRRRGNRKVHENVATLANRNHAMTEMPKFRYNQQMVPHSSCRRVTSEAALNVAAFSLNGPGARGRTMYF